MNRKYYLVILFILLSACGPAARSSPTPSIQNVLQPLPTATIPVTSTSTATKVAPSLTPTATLDPNFFRDDFDGSLNPEWSWVRENSLNWSLTNLPGALQINVQHGHVVAHNYSNLLLRPAPAGDFQIETQITFRPDHNFQFAGLIIYESDSNFIQGGRAYCNAVGCVGEGLYMDHYTKGIVVEPDFGQTYREIDPIQLRLSRRGHNYTFEASTDGKVWFIIGSHTSDINPLQVGLVAGQTLQGQIQPATFAYFEVRSLP